jgi:hypothetical protein
MIKEFKEYWIHVTEQPDGQITGIRIGKGIAPECRNFDTLTMIDSNLYLGITQAITQMAKQYLVDKHLTRK